MKRTIVLALLMVSAAVHAEEKKTTKGKSGAEYEPIIGTDGKAPEMTLKGMVSRSMQKMDVGDHELTKDLSPYGLQIDMGGYLWVAHVPKSFWETQKAKGHVYIELPCTGVAKQHDPRGFTILHCRHGKQASSWWPF